MPQKVRVGIVGAGNLTTGRLLPNFQAIPDVEVTAVANRRRETAQKVADQFHISHVMADYHEVIASSNVDAIFIGTPPYLHREIAIAALEAGKHVLCQTRIANSADEARDMHRAAEAAAARGVRSALVPPAPYYRGSRFVEHLVKAGYLGKLRHVISFNMNDSLADSKAVLRAARNPETYGQFSALQVGLSYDVIARWTGHATSVVAQQATFTTERPLTPDGPMAKVPYPDEVTVIADTTSGAVAVNMQDYAVHFSDPRIELYGESGTVIYRSKDDAIVGAKAGEGELKPLAIPAEFDSPWKVEEEFVRLIRGEIERASFTFWDGVKNMEYLEASYYAAIEGRRVELPK